MATTKLFDVVNCLFNNSNKFKRLKNRDLQPHYFMINRFFAINFPTQANNFFNRRGVGAAQVIKSWSLVGRRYSKVPGWIYTKTKKKKSKTKKKKSKKSGFDFRSYEPSDEMLQRFLNRYQYAKKDYLNALEMNEKKTKKILYDFEKSVKGYG